MYQTVLPLLSDAFIFVVVANTMAAAQCALMERLYFHVVNGVCSAPALPQEKRVFSLLRRFKKLVLKGVGSAAKVSTEEFLQFYTGRKLALYTRAAWNVDNNAFNPRWSRIKAFVKHEKLPLVPGKKLVPRLIQPRRPEYNVVVGRYLRKAEHQYYRAICSAFQTHLPVVLKGFNALQTGSIINAKWRRMEMVCAGTDHVVAFGLDASRFDQHITRPLLRWEHSVYNDTFHSVELRQCLQSQLETVGIVVTDEGVIKYRCRTGTRCSGDMNTALGNCLLMCGMVHSYCHAHSIPLSKLEVIDNGDDCSIITTTGYLPLFADMKRWFKDNFEIVLKITDPVYRLEHLTFCQTRPVRFVGGVKMVREFPASLSKDATIAHKCPTPEYLRSYLHTVGECGLAVAAGMPVLQEYYKAMIRASPVGVSSDVLEGTGFKFMSIGLASAELPITSEARVSFYEAFGITPYEQEGLEAQYRSTDLSTLVRHTVPQYHGVPWGHPLNDPKRYAC